jgi:hypothetical protein
MYACVCMYVCICVCIHACVHGRMDGCVYGGTGRDGTGWDVKKLRLILGLPLEHERNGYRRPLSKYLLCLDMSKLDRYVYLCVPPTIPLLAFKNPRIQYDSLVESWMHPIFTQKVVCKSWFHPSVRVFVHVKSHISPKKQKTHRTHMVIYINIYMETPFIKGRTKDQKTIKITKFSLPWR